MTERELIAMPDGRKIDILTAGPEDGLPLVVHEGTPIGLELYPPTVEAARRRGLRMVQIARPGYERSTPLPGRTVADIGGDTRVVMDYLGAETFVTAGWSGGGPHALASAALLPERCLGAASIAGVAPHDAGGLDWLAGMAGENVAEFGAATAGEAELTAYLTAEAATLRDITGEQLVAGLGDLASAADQAVITGEFASYLAKSSSAPKHLPNGKIAGTRSENGNEMQMSMTGDPQAAKSNSPYYQVVQTSKKQAESTLSKENIPASLKKQVKDYFDSIKP